MVAETARARQFRGRTGYLGPVPSRLTLPFGHRALEAEVAARVRWLEAPDLGPAPAVRSLLRAALDEPVASPRLEALARAGDRVTLVVSDATRDEPRRALVEAVRERLPSVRWTVAIANGTHGRAGGLSAVGLGDLAGDVAVVDHDGHDPRDLVEVGTTRRGTPVRVHRAAVEAELVVATGVIRPHYFAGFGAGAKAIFPGLAEASAARINHRWKEDPGARPGATTGNPCREDLDEAAALVGGRQFLLDGIADGRGRVRGAVAGALPEAFAAGVARARPWVTVRAAPARWLVVADEGPVTGSLYQAAKCIAAVAPLAVEGGTIVLVAPCEHGVGPREVVEHGIYRIGLVPRLPRDVRIVLVSTLSAAALDGVFARWAPDLASAVDGADELLVVPHASKQVVEVA